MAILIVIFLLYHGIIDKPGKHTGVLDLERVLLNHTNGESAKKITGQQGNKDA
jgi:hypothetical protein